MDKLVQQLDQLTIDVQKQPDMSEQQLQLCQTYAKAVLDTTFYHENYLSEKDFRDPQAERDVRKMLQLLAAIGVLCRQIVSLQHHSPEGPPESGPNNGHTQAVKGVLGEEYAEVLPWRQGSLLFAFCSSKLNGTEQTDTDWVEQNQATILNYLSEGISHLQAMLSVRKPSETIAPSQPDPNPEQILDQLSRNQMEQERRKLLHKQIMLGEENQELEQLEELLEAQADANHEALLDIQQQMQLNEQPQMEDLLQEVQMEVQQQQQEVLDRQEAQEEKKLELREQFLQLQLQQQHLEAMIQGVAERMKAQDQHKNEQNSTKKLVALGIYSDPHLLAIMYSGEMCYWYCRYIQEWNLLDPSDPDQLATTKQLHTLGKEMMSKYLKAVEKCGLNKVGWSSDRAKELRTWFRKNPIQLQSNSKR